MLVHSGATESGSTMVRTTVAVRDISPIEKKSPALRVLIVDDEPLIRWSLAETLMDRGFEVVEAGDGAGTVHTLLEPRSAIDVVLLDYRLPDSKDLTLLSTVRRLAPAAQVIVMTAYGTPEVVEGALALGAYKVVNKPLEMHELPALIEQAHASGPS